jgi:putative ABC transport system permease protein
MSQEVDISFIGLMISSSLVFIALALSSYHKLDLGKDMIISIARAIIQLTLIGYILEYVFGVDNLFFTSILLLIIIFNASLNAGKRGAGIKNAFPAAFFAILSGTIVTITVLVLSGIIKYQAYQIVPVGGMIISNSMIALGLSYKNLSASFKDKREEIQTKLSLGADIQEASKSLIKDAIKTGMMPTIDSAKTMGIVALPGMMTGLILAGVSPLDAIKYQIMVVFMILSTTTISSVIAVYLTYKVFYNERKQLI